MAKRDLWDVLRSGLPKTRNSLLVIATTAGRGQQNVAYEQVDYARKVARGDIIDPATLPILFETPADADWRDEAVWRAANPGLSCDPAYPDIDSLRQYAREAESRPGDRETFRQLHLNVWLDHSATPFVDMSIYDEGAEPFDLARFDGAPCWIGVDLSSTTDLTAVVACFREDEAYFVVPSFFVPADNLRARAERDGVPYPQWAADGFITATPGTVVDYQRVEAAIRYLCSRHDVREIAFDPHLGQQMMARLLDDGLPVVEMRQGWRTMAPAIQTLERAIIGGNFRHGGNPVLRWNFQNVAVHTDSAGNRAFHKGKSTDRIDGAVAAAMAVARAEAGDGGISVFDAPDFELQDMVW